MTEPFRPPLLIVADSPGALTELCGISMLERMRRIALHLGFREAMILSNSVKAVATHVANESWHRTDVSLTFRERTGAKVTVADAQTNPALIDSDPPSIIAPLSENLDTHSSGRLLCAALLSSEWLSRKNRASTLVEEIISDTMAGRIARVDAARQQAYVGSMRRSVRPVFFPAPSFERRPLAERLLRDATQKGVLDFPALVHAPIEKWLVLHLCRTTITPNQITLGTGVLGLGVTLLYACGYLWAGVLLALVIGVLDGIDGKLARLKAQTTKLGKREHDLDYFVETSWWAALAYRFHATGQIRYAYVIFSAFFAFHMLERVAKKAVKR